MYPELGRLPVMAAPPRPDFSGKDGEEQNMLAPVSSSFSRRMAELG